MTGPAAYAQWEGKTYLRPEVGVALLQDATFVDLTGTVPGKLKAKIDPGVRFDVAAGYKFTDSFHGELEGGVIWNSVRSIEGGVFGTGVDVDLYQIPLLANLKWQFHTKSRFTPYCGLGVGAVLDKLDASMGLTTTSETAVVFGYQAHAGVEYRLTDKARLTVSYKFLGTTDATFKGDLQTRADGALNHSVLLGLRWDY